MRGSVVDRNKEKKGKPGYRPNWAVVLDVPRENGKRRQQWVAVKGTKQGAERKLAELLNTAHNGYVLRPERCTLGQYLHQWLDTYATTNVRPRTAEGYRSKLTKHVAPRLGNVPLRSLEPSAITGVYKALLSTGLSPRSVLHVHRILREALEHAVTQGYIARNPCQAVSPPRPERKEMRSLSAQELQRVLEGARETPYFAAFHTLLFTGLRRCELLALRVRDVDLILGTAHVSQGLHTLKGGKVVFSEPKSPKGRRTVALTPSNAVVLREHLERLRGDMALLGLPMTDDTLVFSWPDGRPMLPSAITHNWLRLVRRLGLHGVRLHDARHTHASIMLAQGVHPKIVQERLGHSTIAVTLDTYSHVAPGLQAAAALTFDKMLQPEAPVSNVAPAR